MNKDLNPEQVSYLQRIDGRFREMFHSEPLLIRSPGRINLIGEHTDYNGGLVLPAAINKNIYIAIGKRSDSRICLFSEDYADEYSCMLQVIMQSEKRWANYILGVVEQLVQDGHALVGFNMVFGGDIPEGAGLSSSAAVECGVAFGLNNLFKLDLQPIEMVRTAHAAENQFVGVNCGIMDQFACMMGKKDHVMLLDCQTTEHKYVPFADDSIRLVLFDTRVKHELVSSEYNERRRQCERGVDLISEKCPQVKSLRDVREEMLTDHVKPVDELIYRRCSYVVSEIERVKQVCQHLAENRLTEAGSLMFETHAGLKNDYEVSCPELDFLVECVSDHPAVFGARMMGGGFGGCTINLVKTEGVDELINQVSRHYQEKYGHAPQTYVVTACDGIGTVELETIENFYN